MKNPNSSNIFASLRCKEDGNPKLGSDFGLKTAAAADNYCAFDLRETDLQCSN